MTAVVVPETRPTHSVPTRRQRQGGLIVRWLSTTDHKLIGSSYLISAFLFFMLAGVMALIMRTELARPGLQIVTNDQFDQLFTMHGTLMLLMFATPA
ncbi:MAG: cytochrome c oxidase subunit, partial [Frankiaceae bacterium]|nr:cytochrome c oxidase subunit [Frankiaceae bacterium]